MPRLIAFLTNLPTTSARIVVSIGLSIVFVCGVLVMGVFGKELGHTTLYVLAGFICVMAGLDVSQYVSKRMTEFAPEQHANADAIRAGAPTMPTPPPITSTTVVEAKPDFG